LYIHTLIFITIAVTWRLLSLVISRRNERAIKATGSKEFGIKTSTYLIALHTIFYLLSFTEGLWRQVQPDRIFFLGITLYIFSMLMLALVMYKLRELWTVKLYIASNHTLNRSWIFRVVRHPNYYLSLIPELIGLALTMKSLITFLLIFPIYILVLRDRIKQEESMMKARFAEY
jgi:isoprenylcysteine carboxyl methyltransferase (ICMT) family protein YpbQ